MVQFSHLYILALSPSPSSSSRTSMLPHFRQKRPARPSSGDIVNTDTDNQTDRSKSQKSCVPARLVRARKHMQASTVSIHVDSKWMILPVCRCDTLTQAQVRGSNDGHDPFTMAVFAVYARETKGVMNARPLDHPLRLPLQGWHQHETLRTCATDPQ